MRKFALFAAAALFSAAGSLHFVRPEPYLKIMPPLIPRPLAMVYLSGIAEVAGGLGLLLPVTRRAAGWGLAALLVAVFPANVYMAMQGIQVTAKPIPQAALWARLPLQAVLIAWVLWASQAGKGRSFPAVAPVPRGETDRRLH